MNSSPFSSSEHWLTAITHFDHDDIFIRGRKVEDLMGHGNFADVAFLLLSGRMPSTAESRVWNALMIASSDHGPTSPSTFAARVVASGNRRAPEAGMAAGILAIGDAHGGAGEEAMAYLHEALAFMTNKGFSANESAEKIVQQYRQAKKRLPGMGHRFHAVDPRTRRLWDLAEQNHVAGAGIAMMSEIQKRSPSHWDAKCRLMLMVP
ncbi:citrate/2-methylcitrate synthase [Acerihabitans sp. KWT182]|uniref:citrate synthase (unknown stereospecificity) n=1 Tax=Acerihabitans sp. KWT182 TaxID=3157919 RepID=A0AAU7QD63_9GAMM